MEDANFPTWTSVSVRSNCKFLTFYRQAGGGPLTERHSS